MGSVCFTTVFCALLLNNCYLALASQTVCPKSCLCIEGTVHCDGLDVFPPIWSFSVNTTTLIISHSPNVDIRVNDLQQLKHLTSLTLSFNKIRNISTFGASKLSIINLEHNEISRVEPGAFDGLTGLIDLSLANNVLESFPVFRKPSSLKKLFLGGNPGITKLSRQSLWNLPQLQLLSLKSTGITDIPYGIFSRNKELRQLVLNNTVSLTTINENAFDGATALTRLDLSNTRVTSLPSQGLENLEVLTLRDVPEFWKLPTTSLWNIQEMYLNQYNAFLCCAFYLANGKPDCATLSGQQGQTATDIAPTQTTTQPVRRTTGAPVTNGGFETPPTGGTEGVGTPPTRDTGGFGTLPTRDTGGFGTPPTRDTGGFVTPPTKDTGGFGTPPTRDTGGFGTSPTRDTGRFGTPPGGGGGGFGTPPGGGGGEGWGTPPGGYGNCTSTARPIVTLPPGFVTNTHKVSSRIPHANRTNANVSICPKQRPLVKCYPQPDAFHPCEDVMGATWLTAVSFLVGAVGLVANFVVALVLLMSERRLNVTRFLMCNLAFADFCLGLYIFILACVSMDTHGEYYNYVRTWQYGTGCKIVGFFAVFATELSVYTLTLITLERFYAIVYAMQMNTRLTLRMTVRAMVGGWVLAILLASLPYMGASSYGKVAICLPFDVSNAGSTAYVAFLLFLNGGAFGFVLYLYARMLLTVMQGGDMEGAPKRNDSKVAKRMALLVLTDFICWAPMAFFGLLAAFGVPLIGVTESKTLLVFFFPINSLCNPFLYAFFTKAFKREFFVLLSRCGFCKIRALKYTGTLSSFMYSRRKASTFSEQSKRISTASSEFKQSTSSLNSTPTGKKRSAIGSPVNGTPTNKKPGSLVNGTPTGNKRATSDSFMNGTPMGNKRTNSSKHPLCKESNNKEVTGTTNPGFTSETLTSVRYVSSASDQVFFPPSPTLSNQDSPKSALKKASVTSTEHPVTQIDKEIPEEALGKASKKFSVVFKDTV